MSTMRTVTTTVERSSNSIAPPPPPPPLDNNLDMLLEDLQTSVGRPAINGHGGGTTYREVTRTYQSSSSTPPQVQYLAPANPTTVVAERAPSPNRPQPNPGMTTFKTVSYEYSNPNTPGSQTATSTLAQEDARLKHNLHELDSLLVDLHQAQKTNISGQPSNSLAGVVPSGGGMDSSLLEPLETSTPTRGGHVSRVVQRTYTTTMNEGSPRSPSKPRSNSSQREIAYHTTSTTSGTSSSTPGYGRATRSPSPMRRDAQSTGSPHVPRRALHKEFYYETSSSSRPDRRMRDKSPTNERLQRELLDKDYNSSRQVRTYTSYGSRGPSPSPYQETTAPLDRESPLPHRRDYNSSKVTTNTVRSYSGSRGPSPAPPYQESSIDRRGPDYNKVTSVRTYNYTTTGGSRGPSPAPPHHGDRPLIELPPRTRSPSPSGGRHTTITYTYEIPPDRDTPRRYQVSPPEPETVTTYKYTTHRTQKYPNEPENEPLLPRPFPASPSPGPDQQQPPKRLDDLMASFGDPQIHEPPHHRYERHVTTTHQQSSHGPREGNGVAVGAAPQINKMKEKEKEKEVEQRVLSKNVAGPPVYYPPGVEMFAHKESAAGGGGGHMQMAMMKESGQYEMSRESRSKQSSSGGAAVVPVCLPLCCAMPCVIM